MVVKAKITAAEKRGGGGGRAVVEEETMCNNNSSSGGGGGGGLMRKGPWTEQEDAQLVWFVRLLGERRWDFLAKVSGLKRTGKSCRLRWVNYLHPDLKRGRITPDEELLIVQLYAQWGSRWSRIARKLPGRTDNEIKNYWRTHTRKKAQEEKKKKKREAAPASSSSSSSSSMSTRTTTSCSASLNNGTTATSSTSAVTTEAAPQESTSGDEAEEATTAASQHQHHQQPQPQEQEHYYSMDQLWNEIAAAEAAATSYAEGWGSAGHIVAAEPAASMPSPVWEFCADYSLWRIDDEE